MNIDALFYGIGVLQLSSPLGDEGMDENTFSAFLQSSMLHIFLRREATLFSVPKTA